MIKIVISLIFSLTVLIACQPPSESAVKTSSDLTATVEPENLQRWLTQLTDQVIIPGYRKLHMSSQQMVRRSEQFCLNRTDEHALQSTRIAWQQLLLDWHQTEAFLFGPAVENDRDLHMYYRFPKSKVITRLLTKTEPVTLDDIDEAGIGAQGIGTLEYLLFSYERSSAEMTTEFTTGNEGVVRCSLLIMVAKDLELRLADLYQDWTAAPDSYRDSLLQSGSDSAYFVSQQQALDQVLSKFYQSVETSAQRRRNNESFKSGLGFVGVQGTINTAQHIFQSGLKELLEDNGQSELAEKLQAELSTLNNITIPVDMFHRRDGYPYFEEVDQYFTAALNVANLIRNDVAEGLGLQLTLFDADGDF